MVWEYEICPFCIWGDWCISPETAGQGLPLFVIVTKLQVVTEEDKGLVLAPGSQFRGR